MRLTSWNCFRGTVWEQLARLTPLRPDLVVLQECSRPSKEREGLVWSGISDIQGVAVAALNPTFRLEPLAIPGVPPTIVPVVVHCRTPFVLVGVWTLREPTYAAMALSAISLCAADRPGVPMVAAGDFNLSPKVASQKRSAPRFLRSMREQFGLVSTYHHFHGVPAGNETHATFYDKWQAARPFHIDYALAPELWAERVKDVEVGGYDEWTDSDHRPLTVAW